MLTDFKLPELGENIKSGIATKVLVKAGDVVKKDQPILELETDKAVLEIPSSLNGLVKEVLVKSGSEVKIGQLILKIDTDASTASAQSAAAPTKTSEEKTEDPKTPPPSNSSETPKTQQTITKEAPVEQAIEVRADVAAAPSVRRFAREIGIDINRVPGSGPRGRISIEDVKAYSKALNTGAAARGGGTSIAPAIILPDFSKWGAIEHQAMSPLRKKAAEHLTQAWQTIPHVTQFDKADITEIEKLRKRFAEKVEKAGGKLTITSFLLKVLGQALKNFPQFNASIDPAKNEIILKKYIHIGIAVDTDRGLLVPVIRDIDKKSITELSVELTQLAERARNKKTTLEEMQGGTFTITNLGGIGGTSFTPIVNLPEVAILGISRASMEHVYMSDHFVPRLMLPLSLSYDHRVIDGADGARFLRWVVDAIQHPFLMELEG